MGLFNIFRRTDRPHREQETCRKCHFEAMEPRQLLDADPLIAGITYLESDLGQDNQPDYFEVTFQGGSQATQMTRFVINGDQDLSGNLSDGDMFFDVSDSYPGTGQHHPFRFDAANSAGVTSSDVLGAQVSDDGLSLIVNLRNFQAGDKLAFTIDVDEVERLRVDKIASGVEFEATFFSASFVDENYNFTPRDIQLNTQLEDGQFQNQYPGVFFDEYNDLLAMGEELAGSNLDLVRDNQQGFGDRTAGAIDAWELVPKPVAISGSVYHGGDPGCDEEHAETGIPGVQITLQRFHGPGGQYQTVATTVTDANGDYEFGKDLGLLPGKFRIVEAQPAGYLDAGASTGTVAGQGSGVVAGDNVLSEVLVPLGGNVAENYDFLEILPASLGGSVYHDANDNGIRDPGEQGIANVLIRVTRTGSGNNPAADPFPDTATRFVRTDAAGRYQVDGLPPGVYQITEINNYPPGEDPLAGFVDGRDTAGRIGSLTVGTVGDDQFDGVLLCAGGRGVEYNFGELKPGSISGYVSLATPEGDCLDPGQPDHQGISGVSLRLFDSQGILAGTTMTDAAGRYQFSDLKPGVYSVAQVQPAGYLDGADSVGRVDGSVTGSPGVNDQFVGIDLTSGSLATDYNFCEHLPATLKGNVWHDANNDGVFGVSEQGIPGVTIQLFDAGDRLVAETLTDENGRYGFENLYAGQYRIVEIQPAGFADGRESVGTIAGTPAGQIGNDVFRGIDLREGQQGVDYNFGELRLGAIDGFVHLDRNGDCLFSAEAGDQPLGGVTLQLLDGSGGVIAETATDARGRYSFEGLLPGVYSVRQVQPGGLFTAGERPGTGSGEASENLISGIVINSGQRVSHYDFCEEEAAEIHGRVWEDGPPFETADGRLPDGYRDQRDGVYDPGVDTPLGDVRLELWFYVDQASGEIGPRPVTLSEVLNDGRYDHLGGHPDAAVWVRSTADGEYSFTGLRAGNYIVVESQPTGLVDANDFAGSTSGFTYNSDVDAALAPSILTSTFSGDQIMDSIVNIRVNSGSVSVQNNFSEVRSVTVPDRPVFPATPRSPDVPGNPVTPTPPPGPGLGLAGAQVARFTAYIGGNFMAVETGQETPWTWHLSVVNGGYARGEEAVAGPEWLQADYRAEQDWERFDMNGGQWTRTRMTPDGRITLESSSPWFGMTGGTALAGDFNGDGIDEFVVFRDGYWMIDLNGNGRWDLDDLMTRLGNHEDRPVVGDWDGDGKDDIGIYGPAWEGDQRAIESDPGFPDPDNLATTTPKNVPPAAIDATDGSRLMKLTSHGSSRIDVIDHVFGYGEEADIPVSGDWNGDSIRTIGVFRNGTWHIDTNGDGRLDPADVEFVYGRSGDVPLVGDFNGDGIEEVAIYRDGNWMIDSNGNRELDATDTVFEMGGADDQPVVGDWNGDGIDEPALYQAGKHQASAQQ